MSESESSRELPLSIEIEKKKIYDFLERDDVNDASTLRRISGNLVLHGTKKPSKKTILDIIALDKLSPGEVNDLGQFTESMREFIGKEKQVFPKEKVNTRIDEPTEK